MLRCDDSDCRSSESSGRLDRCHLGYDLRRRRLEVRELDPSLQTTRTSPIFDNVAMMATSKASRTISVVDDLTFPRSIANSKACVFLGFQAIWGRWWLAEAL
ncbi:hypothetical protein TIFTF001_053507 [Ficus carica]|uniref:Uncharacterized protein n=1 Tax=Ficus carica TaxID=3494 RepID=A0AA88ECY7_FICCA|nr:hypothetical protein TIFTF001_053507 [Ficus carica]